LYNLTVVGTNYCCGIPTVWSKLIFQKISNLKGSKATTREQEVRETQLNNTAKST
jgi:hypothetical protein